MIIREVGKTLLAQSERSLVTSSTGSQVFVATDNVVISCSAANGLVLDRFGAELGRRYKVAEPFAYLNSSRGSTEADKRLYVEIKLQHGDSSGGGDMADFSTGAPSTGDLRRNFLTTAETTPMYSYSTGVIANFQSKPVVYDLTGAKRFVRTVVTVGKHAETTESSGFEGMRFGAAIRFGQPDEWPDRANSTGFGSTSTSTST